MMAQNPPHLIPSLLKGSIKHRRTLGRNGKKISEKSETTTDKVKGKAKVVDTKKDVSVKKENFDTKEDTKTKTKAKKGKWIKSKK